MSPSDILHRPWPLRRHAVDPSTIGLRVYWWDIQEAGPRLGNLVAESNKKKKGVPRP